MGSAHFAREGETLQRQGRTDEALRLLADGVARFPRDIAGRLVLARACRDAGRAAEARGWLESVLRDDPECPSARLALAALSEGVERERHLARLRAHEPWDDGAGWILDLEPDSADDVFDEEEDLAEAEIDVDSLPHVATVTLAEIYFSQGLNEQAAQIYRQLLERPGPEDASIRKRLEEIETSISEASTRATGGNPGGNG